MKASTCLGLTSLALNLILIGTIATGLFGGAEPVRRRPKAPTPTATKAKVDPGPRAETWAELSAIDLSTQRDRLAAEGFPPSAIRALIGAQVREGFAARRKALDAAAAAAPFWKSPIPDPQTQAAYRAIAKEEQMVLQAVLGADPDHGSAARLRRQFPGLPADKIDQLAEIRDRYDEQRQDFSLGGRGAYTPSEREQMAALDKAQRAEIAAVLSPEELENYDLRTSNTANSIRSRLRSFEPTESEFRALYRLQSAFDGQFAAGIGTTLEQQQARREAQRQLDDQIAATLGPSRHAEYQRASDYNFQQTSNLVTRLGLPAETATSLYQVQKQFEELRNAAFRNSSSTSRDELTRQMTVLQEQATARVITVLGGNTTAVDAYKQYGGSWLGNMIPRFTPPPRN